MEQAGNIYQLTPSFEERIQRNPLLNIDTFIIPSPYVRDNELEIDYSHSYVWMEEGEILGYVLVFADSSFMNFHIYKLVTSPFVRGRGIGTAFIMHLAEKIPETSSLYLYIWEKQTDTIEFFRNKGFVLGETIVYRNLIYYHMSARQSEIIVRSPKDSSDRSAVSEEIGKTRHDARKTLRLLASMIDNLTLGNCDRIIEDINRESTTLVNILNAFRDSVNHIHEVDLQRLLLERIVPYIENSSIPCGLNLKLNSNQAMIMGYYINIGRALVNLVSNSLDAIESANRRGIIEIGIDDDAGHIFLTLIDNGTGIPARLLERDSDGIPAFVGNSTKERKVGEGLGTVQIFSTFGAENIDISSIPGEGTTFRIRINKSPRGIDLWYVRLERRFHEFKDLWEEYQLDRNTPRTDVIAFIWQLRKMEIFLFDLIFKFSRHHNIREIYRSLLGFLKDRLDSRRLEEIVAELRCEHPAMKDWLIEICRQIKRRQNDFDVNIDTEKFQGALFKSYGQAFENLIIFTMDPDTGMFMATDRKLAEHLDFAMYLGKERDSLLRGEFNGDINNHSQPIFLGVWSISSKEDLAAKLKLIRQGARRLIDIGIHPEKKLAFYKTTYVRYDYEIDADASSTLGEFAETSDDGLMSYIHHSESEIQEMLFQND